MKNAIILVLSISVICGCAHLHDENNELRGSTSVDLTESYYDTLKSLLSENPSSVRPKPSERDINLIEPEKGGAGVLFGATMEEVLAVWGKPSGFWIERHDDVWKLEMGASDFAFIDNSLVGIEIHRATLGTAHFRNGISFTSSIEEVTSALGEPSEETKFGLEYYTENDFFISFTFTPEILNNGAPPELINISIYHPDAGK